MSSSALSWLLVLVVLGWAAAPLAGRLCEHLPDRGLGIAKPLSLILVTYGGWLAASSGVPRPAARWLGVGLVAVFALALWRDFRRLQLREVLLHEALFAAALAGFAALRAFNPDIIGAEKYMDFALFNAVGRADRFPPEDPWLAGAPVNYYYFGYVVFADLARVARVPPEVGYNLALATIGAMVFTGAVSVGRALTGRLGLGLLGAAAAAVFGNLDTARRLAKGTAQFARFDYWPASRVVPNTITEFPFFSLYHGDLHPHVSALPINVTLVALACGAAWEADARGAPLARTVLRPLRLATLAIVFAALVLTNPWDVPLMSTFVAVLVFAGSPRRPVAAAAVVLGLLATAMGLALPFLFGFVPSSRGVGLVHERTALADFLTVFGVLVLPVALLLVREGGSWLPRNDERRDLALAACTFSVVALVLSTATVVLALVSVLAFVLLVSLLRAHGAARLTMFALLASAAVALLACEVVHVRDDYGVALHRMNTVFKLYFGAWLLLSLALPGVVHGVAVGFGRAGRVVVGGAVFAGTIAALCYPVAVIATELRSNDSPSLDGMRYLARHHPDDAAAIGWLRRVEGRPVVLEATGDPYGYFARVSVNTGLPTVLGWANHERVWRGPLPEIEQRRREVDTIYGSTDMEEVDALLRRHHVRYVFVGELERQRFGTEALAKFFAHPSRFARVFVSGGTEVFEVEPRPSAAAASRYRS